MIARLRAWWRRWRERGTNAPQTVEHAARLTATRPRNTRRRAFDSLGRPIGWLDENNKLET
jgi:transposase-like protein